MIKTKWSLRLSSLAVLALVTAGPSRIGYAQNPGPLKHEVVINEIHYDPDIKTEQVEFIELYNKGATAVDLSGWRLADAVEYIFPAGTSISSNGYLVVAENPTAFQSKFKVQALGPWTGVLSNEGETVLLCDAAKRVVDRVDYQLGFPWPTVGDSPGHSIELIHPELDNELGGNWRSGGQAGPVQETALFLSEGLWHYRKGTSEASTPIGAWRELAFPEDATWQVHSGPVGYDPTATASWARLDDMNGNYTSVYLRKTFAVTDPSRFSSWRLEALYDDGFNCWINGRRVAFAQVSGENLSYDALASGTAREANTYDLFPLADDPAVVLKPGLNVIAVQFFNILKSSSSDAFFDARLIASTGGGGSNPTPGRKNSVFAVNAPPVIRQVTHTPLQPGSNQAVTISAKVTDPDGVASVSLAYQIVNPGAYFSKNDAAYADPTSWVTIAMKDDGQGDDLAAGDGVYTVQIPAGIQTHRRLVRYRITATDGLGRSITAPYADDPQPNFAYFVYDGVPPWSGAIQASSSDAVRRQVVTYDFAVMPNLPVYHLLTTRKAHEESQSIPNSTVAQYWGSDYLWTGTLVYDGVVYDHIGFRARGGVWRYSMGKNMWKIAFQRGHEFQARDEYGRPLGVTWKKLNLGANIQQGDYGHRGEQGLFEYTGFRLFNLAGTPASIAFPVHFRIIENASEINNTTSNQYDDDFQGLYLAVEQPDGRFLDQHGLPDGNLYKMEGGGQLNNQGPTQPSNGSDLNSFTNGYSSNPSESWWRSNLDLQEYYAYRAITEGIHHGDVGYGKNYFYYHNPLTNRWSIIPWDLDLTWAETMYGNGDDPLKARLLYTNKNYSGVREPFNTEYRNRLREIMDLLYNSEQVGQMIDEYSALVNSPNPGPSMVDADRALWDYNQILTSSYINSSKAGWGRFYQAATTKDFPGMAQKMKDYIPFVYTHTRNWMGDPSNGPSMTALAADPVIASKPTVTYVGPAGYPADRLDFRSSAFSGTVVPFGSMKWRIAEVSKPATPPYDPNDPRKYEIQAAWESPEITPFASDIRIPTCAVEPGRIYRVRCRMEDLTGRSSNWSAPIQFTAGAPAAGSSLALRITEIMYHPPVSPSEDGWDADEFEFVELMNVGTAAIDLAGVRFVEGIKFDFARGAVTRLGPAEMVLVVANRLAFECRYGTAMSSRIAGEYKGSLANNGEAIKLIDYQTGVVAQFAYADTWYAATDGQGSSLVLANPSQVSPDQLGSKTAWRASYHWGGSPGSPDVP
jgi:spore coat protein CotH